MKIILFRVVLNNERIGNFDWYFFSRRKSDELSTEVVLIFLKIRKVAKGISEIVFETLNALGFFS